MHFHFLSLGILSTFFSTICNGEQPNRGSCSNPGPRLNLLDVCWLREEKDQHTLKWREQTEKFNLRGSTARENVTTSDGPPPNPWTHHPVCNSVKSAEDMTFCVYTSTSFASGRGISIVGTPQSVELISRNRVFHTPPVEWSKKSNPSYLVQQLPGRGYGLLANTTLHVGDEVLSHTPIIVMQAILDDHLSKGDLSKLFHVAVEQLPLPTREMFLALQGHEGEDEMYSRFTTNAFEIYDYAAIFPETARLNHDCRPNARYYFDKRTFTHHVHATRTIFPGDEITISYLSHYLTSSQRAEKIPRNWKFKCTCALCSSSEAHLHISDARLDELSDTEFDIMEGKGTVRMAERLMKLYEMEQLDAPAAKAFEIAAVEYKRVGDLEKALEFARRAVAMGKLWLGPGSPDFRRMLRLEEELAMKLRGNSVRTN